MVQNIFGHAQYPLLQAVGIDHRAALEPPGAAGNGGETRGHQSARAGFGQHQPFAVPLQEPAHDFRQAVVAFAEDMGAQSGPDQTVRLLKEGFVGRGAPAPDGQTHVHVKADGVVAQVQPGPACQSFQARVDVQLRQTATVVEMLTQRRLGKAALQFGDHPVFQEDRHL